MSPRPEGGGSGRQTGPERATGAAGRRSLAARGEDEAAAHLRARGCRILDRNWRSGRREIDLVVLDGATVAFVEVKARTAGPQDALEGTTLGQRRRVQAAAEAWIHAHPGVGEEFRFDLVAVRLGDGGRPEVEHVPGAWFGDR